MEVANLIYHFLVIVMSILVFFLNITFPNAFFEIVLKFIGKIVPLFCILYAGVQIFKYFGLI